MFGIMVNPRSFSMSEEENRRLKIRLDEFGSEWEKDLAGKDEMVTSSDSGSRFKWQVNTEVQTDQPPGTSFSQTVSFSSVYDAYEKDHSLTLLEKQKEVDKEQGHDIMVGIIQRRISLTLATTMTPPLAEDPDKPSFNLPGLHQAAMILERMVNQNIYDDIIQDFMYWEDGGDDYHPLEGSLLPLWKFATDTSRSLVVSDVCWSPVYRDLFAASYTTGEVDGAEEGGMVCLFTLKNPSTPERTFRSQCGVTCVHFHPKYGSMVGAGWSDGTVVVYDVSSLQSPLTIYSSPVNGKHLLPVTRVRWVETDVEAGLSLFSVSLDGRVTQWQVTTSALLPSGVLDFSSDGLPTFNRRHSAAARARFHGKGTCIAFKPDDVSEVLVGVDNGCVYQMSTSCPTYTLTRYPAHTASVRAIAWNNHHHQVFISCSLDWTVKIWLQYYLAPLMTLDLGGAVAGVQWATYSSSVFVAVTDDGCVHVYDLFIRTTQPMCTQRLLHRRQLTVSSVALSPRYPLVLVGGERGYLLILKLSPNLRKICTNPKNVEEVPIKDLELSKIERLISVNKEVVMDSFNIQNNGKVDEKLKKDVSSAMLSDNKNWRNC
ncbi:dynein axonemal intermediate chain 1-like [Cherax quadricarinatus]|uniref:dynein axonemal intermediate chain 1-like n=1 Tax=Cherax quadricarinatus TaxID=27406 RepID=UPI00387E2728